MTARHLNLTAAAVVAASGLLAPDATAADPVYELRIYHCHPGKLEALHTRFREHTLGFFKTHGLGVVGFWTPRDADKGKDDTLVYLLKFPNRDSATAAWKAFVEDPDWQKARDASHKDGPIVKSIESIYLDFADYGPRPGETPELPGGEERVYELRTYVASEGKFEALNRRFREHTDALFRKHGMAPLGYWIPQDADKGKADTLIYLLAYPSSDAAKASWKAFGDDPEWQRVYKESQPDGVKLAGKVESVYLVPTDYSPLK